MHTKITYQFTVTKIETEPKANVIIIYEKIVIQNLYGFCSLKPRLALPTLTSRFSIWSPTMPHKVNEAKISDQNEVF